MPHVFFDRGYEDTRGVVGSCLHGDGDLCLTTDTVCSLNSVVHYRFLLEPCYPYKQD